MPKSTAKFKRFRFEHPDNVGLGHYYKGAELTAEMTELDLHSGVEVENLGTTDDENDVILVRWVDRNGLDRITSVPADFFNQNFTEV